MRLNTLGGLTVAFGLLVWSPAALCADLLQVFQAAQAQDATVQASRAAAQGVRERLPLARAQMLPVVSASMSRNDNRLVSTTPNFLGTEQSSDSAYRSSNESLTVRQPLVRVGLLAQVGLAQAIVNESEANLAQDEQELAVRVAGAYFEALMAQEQNALLQSQRGTSAKQLEASRATFKGGSGTRTDVDEAQARLDMVEAQLLETRLHVEYTLRQLQSLVDDPVGVPAPLRPERLDLSAVDHGTLESWLERVERASPRIRALSAQVDASRLDVSRNRGGHFPSLDLVGQWTRSASENVQSVNSSYTNASVGLQLQIPIYSGGSVSATVRQSLANQVRAEHALEAGLRELRLRVHKEFRTMVESVPRIHAYEQALRSADQMVLSNRMSFKAGSRTVMDVLNAEQQRLVTQRDLTQSRFQYLLARVRLNAMLDNGGQEAIAAINPLFTDR